MECLDCPMKYIFKTGRVFSIRYKEHIQAIRNKNSNTGYASHMLNTGHAYGSISDAMDVISMGKNGKHLNTLKKYHIYTISKINLHMNGTNIEARTTKTTHP
jgi:hypothetical protein